ILLERPFVSHRLKRNAEGILCLDSPSPEDQPFSLGFQPETWFDVTVTSASLPVSLHRSTTCVDL
ncbi:hypothetical protein ATANTOWER_025361, partial [Ataeniobius toweri]|nr:hypothetical protein [Ataeniobius toweri]